MSLIFTDSFGGMDSVSKWNGTTGGSVLSLAGARTNGYVWNVGVGPITLTKNIPVADQHAVFTAGMAIYRTGNSTTTQLLTFLSGGTTNVTLNVTSGAVLQVWRGATTTGVLLGSVASPFLVSNSWYYVEARVVLDDVAGSVEIRVDGAPLLSLTGVDTKEFGTVHDRVLFRAGAGGASSFYLSDVFITNGAGATNTGFLNAPHVVFLTPDGNGSSSMGLGSDADSLDNYLLVDEPIATATSTQDNDWVDLVNTGDKDLYTFTSAPVAIPTANEVYGVGIWSWAQKTDAAARSLVHVARSGASESDADAAALAQGVYGAISGFIEAKPGGGTWTVADLNAMTFGIKAGT